jgi:hypothetical protein
MKKTLFLTLVFAVFMAVSCKKPMQSDDLTVNINYSVNGKPLITDSLCYQNEAGNEFMITEIQWFISKMGLQTEQGEWVELEPRIFYIDTNIPESQALRIASIPVGKYKTLRFTFGLDEVDNQTGIYSDPPESNMFWPEMLGGGYHYMKLNGKFVDANGQLVPLNVHLGIGQNADHSEFYQNYFTVEGPINLNIAENTENQFNLTMIVDNWFRNPNLYDFNTFGSAIMQNQAAQQALKENGKDVFTTSTQTQQNPTAMKQENLSEIFKNTMQKAAPKPHFWTWENVKERFQNLRFKDLKFKI